MTPKPPPMLNFLEKDTKYLFLNPQQLSPLKKGILWKKK